MHFGLKVMLQHNSIYLFVCLFLVHYSYSYWLLMHLYSQIARYLCILVTFDSAAHYLRLYWLNLSVFILVINRFICSLSADLLLLWPYRCSLGSLLGSMSMCQATLVEQQYIST